MKQEDILRANQRTIEKAERLEALAKKDGWKDFVEVVDQLIQAETIALAGQKLDESYYKKIGFLQYLLAIKEIPSIIKDKETREYLLHQGRLLGAQTIKQVPFLFNKRKKMAIEQLKTIMANPQDNDELKQKFNQQVYQNS